MRWPFPGNGARYRLYIAFLALSAICVGGVVGPSAIDLYRLAFPPDTEAAWDSKVGWRLCDGAIAAWPDKPAPQCWKLTMCDNEGGLTEDERTRLKQMIAQNNCAD
jgi:hypothetical protein